MEWWQAIPVGLVQGITEFLPVSSDGHVALTSFLLGIKDMPLATVVLVHAGTLIATALVLRVDVAKLVQSTLAGIGNPRAFAQTDEGRLVLGILLASVPTAVIGLGLEDHVEAWAHVPWIVGVCFVVTGLVLLTTRAAYGTANVLTWTQYFLVGVAQGIAVLPGVSRSGCTIAMAMALGLSGPAAFRLSFLMSLPAVAGAVLLQFLEPGALASMDPSAALAAVVALVSGVFALILLRGMVANGRFWSFALYVLPLGVLLTVWGLLSPNL